MYSEAEYVFRSNISQTLSQQKDKHFQSRVQPSCQQCLGGILGADPAHLFGRLVGVPTLLDVPQKAAYP